MTIYGDSRSMAETDMPRQLPLRSEREIVACWKGDIHQPIVSVCCPTYNHGEFLKEAIHSFLMQKTNFPFEIIIRDDASDDGTTEIVLDYARRYPTIVRTLINEANRFKMGERAIHVWPSVVKGKYIALCEGDDFWITTDKLQKQVELLEKYPHAVMCAAKTHVFKDHGNGMLVYQNTTSPPEKDLLDFDDTHRCYLHTSTYMVRTVIFKEVIEKYFSGHCLFGDTALRAIFISYGPFALLNEPVSVYRITGNGIWSSLDLTQQLIWDFNATKKLAGVLSGRHAHLQRKRLPDIAFQMVLNSWRNHSLLGSIKYLPLALVYISLKWPCQIARRLKLFLMGLG